MQNNTTPSPSCISGFNFNHFTHYSTIPAAVIIFILAFLERRREKRDCCNGRPALIVPMHLLDGYENRMAYAAAFGAVTNDIINLFMESRNTYPFDYPLWAVALILQLQAMEVTLTCFPLFACIATRHRLVGSVCGLLYGALLCCGIITVSIQEYCNLPSDLKLMQAGSLMRNLPVIACYLYLMLRSAGVVVNVIVTKIFTLQENTDVVRPHQTLHVRLLLKGYYNEITLKKKSILDHLRYTSVQGFLYPAKIVCVVFIIFILLYQLIVVEIIVGHYLEESVDEMMKDDAFDNKLHFLNITVVFLTPGAVKGMLAVYFISGIVSSILGIFHIYFFMKVYRKNMLRLYRGDRSFMFDDTHSSQYLMASSMRFPGYQIAYSLWGTVIMLVSLLGLGLIVCYVLFFMAANGYLLSFVSTIAQLLSFPATTFVLFYVQLLLAKYFLLQPKLNPADENPPVNVNNRRFYEDFNFFTLFGSLAIGIVSCFLRILIGTVTGIIMVGRLDKSTFMKNTETFDKGHMCYISMLHVDNAHNHPVLRVFCGILWDRTLIRRETNSLLVKKTSNRRHYRTFPSVESPSAESSFNIQPPSGHTLRQVSVFSNARPLRKWNLAYTLLKNQGLSKLRKHYLSEKAEKKLRKETGDECEMVTVHTWDEHNETSTS